ncbi:MAG: VWA domain-containing protein [Pyrinomonadaceae bacterium]
MYRLLSLFVIALLGVSAISAQSGRRVTAAPAPVTQEKSKDDPSEYSESKPRTSRTARPVERFPGIGQGSEKTTAQAPATQPAADVKDDSETLRIETNLITIPVSVFDRNGLYIPGLRQNDFRIFSDGIEQEIAYFGTSDKPFTVAIVIDVSPSTAYKIDEIQRAAAAFVALLEPQDSVIVIEFDHSVDVLTDITKDREKIYKAIKKADFGDGTSLYNAVDETLRKQLAKVPGRKAVVLFTDGVDTTSRKNTYDSTLNYAEESDSLVFPIYYNTFFDMRGGVGGGWPNGGNGGGILGTILGGGNSGGMNLPTTEEYAVGRRYLEELADATGGRVFRPESTPGGLTRAFEGIAEELRRQYNIGFIPSEEGKPGQRKSIRVRVNRPNLILRARDSYVVGTATGPPVLVENTKK